MRRVSFVIALAPLFLLGALSHAQLNDVTEQNKAVARAAFLEYLNHRDFDGFEAIHTKDFIKHYNNRQAEDLEQEMKDARGQYVASSDLTFTLNWMVAEGDKVAVCFTSRGTQDGSFSGMPATGKKYEVSAMTVWRFRDGKIAEEWVYFNELELYRQLGVIKDPGTPAH